MSRVGRRNAGGSSSGGALEVRVTRDDLGELVAAINKHGTPKEVKKELRRALREAVKPLVPKARASVLGQASQGKGKGPSLRADMARAVEVKVDLGGRNPGVRLRLNGRKLRGRPPGLVAMYEGTIPWRHPVFGDTEKWAAQSHRGFLTEVGRAGESTVASDIEKAMDDIGRKIDG
jgi:hypothetical protein